MTRRVVLVTGPARSGTTLVARMLAAHPDVEMAVDPLFPLFRSLRDALVAAAGVPPLPAGSPLEDYYFRDDRLQRLDAVLDGRLDLPFPAADLPALRVALAARAAHESPHLVPDLAAIEGGSYRDLFDAALDIVAGGHDDVVVAVKDVWVAEFAAPLARAYPGLRVVLVRRDPRAVLASNLGIERTDPGQAAHPLSVARHWRKQEALAARFAADPALAGRVTTVVFEDVVADPAAGADAVCDAAGVPRDRGIADPARHRDAAGRQWQANTSFAPVDAGIRPETAGRWRDALHADHVALAELVCGPEMAALGYAPAGVGGDAAAAVRADDARPWSWRSDLGDPAADVAAEAGRRAVLGGGDAREVRRAWLFPEALAAVSGGAPW